MSLDGTTNTFIPYTINGINPVAGSINTTNFVKYNGNTDNTDLGGFDLTTTGTISAQNFAIPDNNSNNESWISYTVSTMGNPSTTGGLITTNITSGSTMYFTGDVLGAPNFQFTTLGNAGKVVCTNGNSVFSTTINAGQLEYITALTSQAGGVGQANTWTGTNDFQTLTSVAALRITSSISNMDYSLSVNALDQLEIRNLTTGNALITGGDSLAVPVNVNVGGAVSAAETQITGSNYLYGSGVEWRQHVPIGADDFEIWDDAGDRQLRLSRTTGLTVSTMNITDVPSATPTLALGVNGSGGVVSFAVPANTNLLPLNNTWTGVNTFDQPVSVGNRLLGSTDTSPTGNFWIGLRGSGTETERLAIALLGDATTGVVDTITHNKKTNVLNTTLVSSKAFLTQSLRIAGMTSVAAQPGTITGGAPWLMTPNPTNSPFASCFSPTQTWITGARYIFRFTGFSYAIFGMSLTIFQANTANTGANQISATFPFVSGDFTGQFTPNSDPGFVGQVYLQFQGTANKTFTWTSFTYEVGTLEVDGAIDMNGIATINGGSNFAVANNYMQTGSLTIGDNTRNYGGGTSWSSNTAGLLFECLDNTEIAVHDAGLRVASLMYYDGPNNTIFMGRDMGWAVSNVAVKGNFTMDITKPLYLYYISGTNHAGISCEGSGDMVFFTGTGGVANRLRINNGGDITASNNLYANCLIVNGGGNYQAGCLYSDVNWGMLFRAKVAPSAAGGIFGWYDSGGSERMKMLPNGTLQLTPPGDGPGFVHTNGTVIVETWIGGSAGWYGTRTNHPLNFYTNNGSARITIDTNGNVGIGRSPSYKLDVNGAMHVLNDANANDSKTVYGPNATWSAFLTVGSGIDNSGPATAQVLSTNGNLHLDAGNSLDIYYGYYPDSRGTPNTHRFYGSGFYFASGLPQQTSTAIAPICFNGSQAFRSANINTIAYSNNNVSWAGGVNTTYAFYRTNPYVSTQIHGKFSYYVGGAGMVYPAIRIYSQSTGQYWYYDLQAYTNVAYNHATFPIHIQFSSNQSLATGWFDVYVYQNGGVITDGNDQLWLLCDTAMSNQFV